MCWGREDYGEKLDAHSHVSLGAENLSLLAWVLSGTAIVTYRTFQSCHVFNSSNPHTKSISYGLITAALTHARNKVKRWIFHMINLCAGFACIHESSFISWLYVHRKANMNGRIFICKALKAYISHLLEHPAALWFRKQYGHSFVLFSAGQTAHLCT